MFTFPVKLAVVGTLSLLTFIILMEIRIAFREFRANRPGRLHRR